jgi:hydrogenase nickel incorporation protein HypA/HybF
MHEMGIAQNILDIVVATAQKEGATRITRINLLAGELRAIEPLQLTFCFAIVAKDTIADGAFLNIEQIPVRGHCKDCNADFPIEDYIYVCPECSSSKIEITGGNELKLQDIEVE